MATMYKNGVDIDMALNAADLMRVFADPATEKDMYDAGMAEYHAHGEFEFVHNNIVYLIKKG